MVLGAGWGGYNLVQKIDTKKYDVTLIAPRTRTPSKYYNDMKIIYFSIYYLYIMN